MHPHIEHRIRLGQRIWLDDLSRGLIDSGELARWVDRGISGITTNPTIFARGLQQRTDLAADVRALSAAGLAPAAVYEALLLEDIRDAADHLRPVFVASARQTGYVSLEISPDHAEDAKRTVREASRLWTRADRPNVMIKIPANAAGLAALPELMRSGVPTNLTLIFGAAQLNAAWQSWEQCARERITGSRTDPAVAFSVFVSRLDVAIDLELNTLGALPAWASSWSLSGEAGLALAGELHRMHLGKTQAVRADAASGVLDASMPVLVWASTGTKSPSIDPLRYVTELPPAATTLTVPRATLETLLERCPPPSAADRSVSRDRSILEGLRCQGIDLDRLAERLQLQGIREFQRSAEEALRLIEDVVGRRQDPPGPEDWPSRPGLWQRDTGPVH